MAELPLLFDSLAAESSQCADEVLRVLASFDAKNNLGPGGTDGGLSFLELKNLTMVEYLSNLAMVLLKKSHGMSINGDPAVDRIAENRTVLEKMRPIERKLRYQVDKYLSLADDDDDRRLHEDPLDLKPNFSALEDASSEDDDGGDVDGEADAGSGTKKYVVPKNVPALCEEDLDKDDLERREKDKTRTKTLSRAILDDLKRQHLETPEEEFDQADTMKAKHVAQMKERIRYEEDNYMRLPTMWKKEKHKRRKSMTTMGTLGDEITHFGHNNFYNEDMPTKKRSRSFGGKGSQRRSGGRKKFKGAL